jgi:hypothetical protein
VSDLDLTQYNGTPSFPLTADVGTSADPYLIPTDGKIVTAESNLADEAPVNRSLERNKDLILGLRGATIGDFPGAARKSFKSLLVDGSGGLTAAIPAGTIQASGDITTTFGSLVTVNGDVLAEKNTSVVRVGTSPDERSEHRIQKLAFLGTTTGTTGANPPQGTPLPNELRAINTPKAWAQVYMVVANVISGFPGCGVSGVTIVPASADAVAAGSPPNGIRITLATAMASVDYKVVGMQTFIKRAGYVDFPVHVVEDLVQRTTSSFVLLFWTEGGGGLDPAARPVNFSVDVSGRQDT